ncbi:type II secretion system protein GspD [bacterium E08(2017)]|nr:type II secretion system protein GspD [bacterium E08(2017)]
MRLEQKRFMAICLTAAAVFFAGSLAPIAQETVNFRRSSEEVLGISPGRLKYNGAPGTRDLILQDYAEKTGRTLLLDPKLPQANITLQSQTELTLDEYLEAIERALRMHGIQLVNVGDKFLKVVPVTARPMQEGLKISEGTDGPLPETGKLVSQMITLKHIDIPEAQKVILPFKHAYGVVHALERSNSLLVTDTQAVVNRMMQIIKYIDQPIVAREEPNVVQIRYAKASDIKAKLEEIIKDSQAEQNKAKTIATAKKTGAPGMNRATIPGVIRPQAPPRAETAEVMTLAAELAERGVIKGKVQIIADERTNLLIIITRPENMKFFDRIIEVLDVETSPDVIVEVFRLEFADSEEVAKMLNELIGLTKGKKDEGAAPTAKKGDTAAERSAALKEYVSRQNVPGGIAAASKVGELSADNIKILADKRTNALIVMASESDVKTLRAIIDDMDMMLSQVLIEAVILDVGIDDQIQTGVDWVQRAMIAYDNRGKSSGRKPLFSFAGGGGGGTLGPLNTMSLTTASDLNSALPSGHGLGYYFTQFGLNLDVILNMSASDTRTEIISSPVIVTHDNTEASFESSVERYFYKGKRWVSTGTTSGTYEDDVESRKVSLVLTVTPKINTNRMVLMEITQDINELGAPQAIGDTEWPTMNTRQLKASVMVKDKETIVLGGLVKKDISKTNKGIPFLRKLPIIGALFRSKSDGTVKSEVVVFITPYVLDNDTEIREEAERRKASLASAGQLWEKGWSDSKLAEPGKEEKREQKRLERLSKKKADEERLRKEQELEEERKAEEERVRKEAEQEARERLHKERLKEIREEAIAKVRAEEEERRAEEEERRAEEEEERRKREEREARKQAEIEARNRAKEEREARDREEKEARARAKAEEKARKIAEKEARERAEQQADPLSGVDPDLAEFIKKQEKRFNKAIRKVDEVVDEEMYEEPLPPNN